MSKMKNHLTTYKTKRYVFLKAEREEKKERKIKVCVRVRCNRIKKCTFVLRRLKTLKLKQLVSTFSAHLTEINAQHCAHT